MNTKLKAAFRVIFKDTGAEYIEVYSGDREPGTLISRGDVIHKRKKQVREPSARRGKS